MTFSGLFTAVVTPFTEDGFIDEQAFVRVLDSQIDAGVDGVVVCGSTGEGATITSDEKAQLWKLAVSHGKGRIKVIAGSGTNVTASSVELSKLAATCGVDGLLVVTPYYNKPTTSGTIAHFAAIAHAVDLPIIMYNVPGRTGSNMSAELQLTIARSYKNIVATKEASANLEQISAIISGAPDHFHVLAGDDVLALPTIALGGVGSIAVVSNYAPRLFSKLIHHSMNGEFAAAREIQKRLTPFYSANFWESNPIPVKYMMEVQGFGKAVYRLPMDPPTADTQLRLRSLLEDFIDA